MSKSLIRCPSHASFSPNIQRRQILWSTCESSLQISSADHLGVGEFTTMIIHASDKTTCMHLTCGKVTSLHPSTTLFSLHFDDRRWESHTQCHLLNRTFDFYKSLYQIDGEPYLTWKDLRVFPKKKVATEEQVVPFGIIKKECVNLQCLSWPTWLL